jgi:hypothetical protein
MQGNCCFPWRLTITLNENCALHWWPSGTTKNIQITLVVYYEPQGNNYFLMAGFSHLRNFSGPQGISGFLVVHASGIEVIYICNKNMNKYI